MFHIKRASLSRFLHFIFIQRIMVNTMSTITQSLNPRERKATAKQAKRQKEKAHRTTVSLAPVAAEIVEDFKAATGLSTSRAIEELILRSEPRKPRIKMVNGRAVIDLPLEKDSITREQILRLEDESW
jgi:hypothetical protein